jgi:probable biosynthetic protein (TIGR04098 family)
VSDWNEYQITVGMPHMAPGHLLSEVELLKWLGHFQWESISRALDTASHAIVNEHQERLYASFINVELACGDGASLDGFGEGRPVHVLNRVRPYGRRFVEGMFLFDTASLAAADAPDPTSKEDLARSGRCWAYMTNAFIARGGSNLKLKLFEPKGMAAARATPLEKVPAGIAEHQGVQGTGQIDPLDSSEGWLPLQPTRDEPVEYPISHESDLNGAGLLYFARYTAMANHGERRFLCERLALPFSLPLVECLVTEHRRIYYFANADPWDTVRIRCRAWCRPRAPGPIVPSSGGRQRLGAFLFRTDLVRASDGSLMACSLARKSLVVPPQDKAVASEMNRQMLARARGVPSGCNRHEFEDPMHTRRDENLPGRERHTSGAGTPS